MTSGLDTADITGRVNRYVDVGRHDEAERIVRRALHTDPGNISLLNDLSYTLYKQKRHDEMLEVCRTALAIEPDSPDMLQRLGLALEALGRRAEAIEATSRGLEQAPDHHYLMRDHAHLLLLDGRNHEAVAGFRRALEVYPDDAVLMGLLGDALLQVDEFREAHELLTASLADRPESADALLSLGTAQMFLFHVRASLRTLALTVRADPDDARRCAVVRYLMAWPISHIYSALRWPLPAAALAALTSSLLGTTDWLQWTITGFTFAAFAYSAHWFARGGIPAWRALFRLPPGEIALTATGIGLGYGGCVAVLAATWLSSPLLAGIGLAATALMWIVEAVEWSLDPDEDQTVPLHRRTLANLRPIVKDDLTVLKQLRARRELRRVRATAATEPPRR